MNNKLGNNKLKISISSLKNVKSLYTECKEVFDDYNRELEMALNYFKNLNQKDDLKIVSDLSSSNSTEVSPVTRSKEEETVQGSKINHQPPHHKYPWVKKIYRAIMIKAHPDKISSEKMNRRDELKLLIAAEDAIAANSEGDYLKLIEIALDLNIKAGFPTTEILEEINSKVREFTTKISDIEKSIQWMWGESYGNINKRVNIITALLNNYKIKIESHEKVEGYVIKLEQDENNPNRNARKIIKRKAGQRPQKIIKGR